MKKGPEGAVREAVGCFCMLILGAILTLGGMVIVLPGVVGCWPGSPRPGCGGRC